MERKQTSFAFLTEMLWVCGFFALAACVFVLVFVKANQLSLGAENLNRAVLTAENTIEDTFAAYHESESISETTDYYDKHWKLLDNSREDAAFCVTTRADSEDGLLKVSVQVTDPRGISIYTLEGSHYMPASG